MRYENVRLTPPVFALIFSLFSLGLFYLLFSLRALDDTRVSSWQDVFQVAGPLKTGLALLAVLSAAFVVSRIELMAKRPAVALFVLSFAMSACFWQEPEMIVDASRYFTQAKHLELYGLRYFLREWGAGINAWTDLPAVPLLYGLIFTLFGESRIFIQAFNSLLFSLAVVLTYATGRELWDRDIGYHAALFLLGIPYLYTQTPLMLVDVPSMFFLMLAVYAFLLALRRGGIMVLLSSVAICTAFFTKYSTWLMLTIIPVIFAAELFRSRKQGLDRCAFRGMLVLFVSFFMISIIIAFKHDEMIRQIHLLLSYQRPGLERWGEGLLAMCLFQMHPLIPLLAVVSVYAVFRKRDINYVIVSWVVLLVFALQVRRVRYIIMVFPMLSLMASYGLALVKDNLSARFVALSTSAFSFAIALAAFLPFLQSTSAANIGEAGRYLDSLDIQTVRVLTPLPGDYVMDPSVSVPLLDLYTQKTISYHYEKADYPLPEDFETSRLRFTWTYKNPGYYRADERKEGSRAVVVITDSTEKELAVHLRKEVEGLNRQRVFGVKDNAYQHQTLVTVYH